MGVARGRVARAEARGRVGAFGFLGGAMWLVAMQLGDGGRRFC